VLSLTAGRVPERDEHERALPLPAGSGSPAWRTLPAPVRVTDLAVDANERPSRREIALGWAYAPHRGDRIRALLTVPPAGGETPHTQVRVHGDTCDGGAGALVAWLDAVAADAADAAVVRAAERLRAWAADGARMDAGSADAGLFARWRHALVRRVAAHPALAALHAPHGLPPFFAPWLDVTARVGDGLARLLAVGRLVDGGPVIDARSEAVAALAEVVAGGADHVWGELHRVVPLHALAEASGVGPDDVPDVPEPLRVPASGARDTVRCTGSVPGVTYAAARGSVARWVWDLSDRRRSRWGVPFGASGDPRSEHFADQHVTWAAAGTAEIETDWARLRPEPVEAP
jgi:penicillin amidase